jgi:DNA invertase Pin-like site-specific DNA recombinase
MLHGSPRGRSYARDVDGDTLIVWNLDLLGRSLCDLITMLDDLRATSS